MLASGLESPSSPLIPVLGSCGLSPCELPVSSTPATAEAHSSLPRNRAFPALPLTTFSAFPVVESVLPRITLGWAGAV